MFHLLHRKSHFILTKTPLSETQHFFELRKVRVVLMKGQVKVSGLESEGQNHENEDSPSAPGISQVGDKNDDDTYRLFVLSLP